MPGNNPGLEKIFSSPSARYPPPDMAARGPVKPKPLSMVCVVARRAEAGAQNRRWAELCKGRRGKPRGDRDMSRYIGVEVGVAGRHRHLHINSSSYHFLPRSVSPIPVWSISFFLKALSCASGISSTILKPVAFSGNPILFSKFQYGEGFGPRDQLPPIAI